MKHITKLGLVPLVAALTASASAWPYSVTPHNAAPSQAAHNPTIAIFANAQGVGQNNAPAHRVGIDLTYNPQGGHRGVAVKSH